MRLHNLRILYIEPFHGGSHRQFGELLMSEIDARWTALTLSGRHWKWRARGSAPYFALEHAEVLRREYDLVWASSFLDLAALQALAPSLSAVPSVLYFHENQLAYPVRPEFSGERDTHFGFSQMISALAATHCVFNSAYNRDSFCAAAEELLRRMPDARPKNWVSSIRAKSDVLPVLMSLDERPLEILGRDESEQRLGPVILWNHRWEHDKGPEVFFAALQTLKTRRVPFRLVVCGERYRHAPKVFEEAQRALAEHTIHWGYFGERRAYLDALHTVDIAVSTARHEFFGLSMLEATHAGARPLVPDRLSYIELFPDEYRYPQDNDLAERLQSLCEDYVAGKVLRADRRELTQKYGKTLLQTYAQKILQWQ